MAINEQNLKPFINGYDPRRNTNGRPKRLLNQLKEMGYGYSQQDLSDAIAVALDLPISKLVEVGTDKTDNYTALEKIAVKTVYEAIRTGKLYHLEILFGRTYGKPKETIDQTITGNLTAPVMVNVIKAPIPLASSEKEVIERMELEKNLNKGGG